MNAGGDGRQCLVSWNQIDISPELIGFDFIIFPVRPKSHKQRVRVDDRCMRRNKCRPNVNTMISCD